MDFVLPKQTGFFFFCGFYRDHFLMLYLFKNVKYVKKDEIFLIWGWFYTTVHLIVLIIFSFTLDMT